MKTNLFAPFWTSLALLCSSAAHAEEFEQFTYRVDQRTGTVTILYYPRDAVGAIMIPQAIDNKPVTSIGGSAFYGCSGLTSVTLPASVKGIGNSAFSRCIGLTSVTLPENVTSIGESAFSGCSGLTSVTLPKNVISIGKSAFSYCSGLTSVTLPASVTSIGDWAFYGCTGLTSVTLPASITSINGGAFYGCTGLTNIEVAATNPNFSSLDGVLFNIARTALIQYPGGKLARVHQRRISSMIS